MAGINLDIEKANLLQYNSETIESTLRIAHVIGSVTKGGVESVVFNYYRAIDRSKVQFDFIIDEDSPCEIPQDIIDLGCNVYKIPSYKHLITYIKSLKNIFIEGDYQIIHSHMNTLSVFTLFAAKLAKTPVRIAHSHSTAGKGEFLRNVMKYTLRPFSRIFASHLFACSEYAGRWLFGNRAFEQGKVDILKNAIDTTKFKFNAETRERVRQNLGISDKFVIGHVGRFMPQKNHTFLIDVFYEVYKQDNESVLLLIGDGELKKVIEEKIERLGLRDCVIFLGSRDDVHELYQAMDVFVLPSLYEGLGIVAIEAQDSGLPCVISKRVPYIVKINKNVLFLSLDESLNAWAMAIINNSGERGDYSKEATIAGYDIRKSTKEYTEFYVRINKRFHNMNSFNVLQSVDI